VLSNIACVARGNICSSRHRQRSGSFRGASTTSGMPRATSPTQPCVYLYVPLHLVNFATLRRCILTNMLHVCWVLIRSILEAEISSCKGACRMHKTSVTSMVLLHKSGSSTQEDSTKHPALPTSQLPTNCLGHYLN